MRQDPNFACNGSNPSLSAEVKSAARRFLRRRRGAMCLRTLREGFESECGVPVEYDGSREQGRATKVSLSDAN